MPGAPVPLRQGAREMGRRPRALSRDGIGVPRGMKLRLQWTRDEGLLIGVAPPHGESSVIAEVLAAARPPCSAWCAAAVAPTRPPLQPGNRLQRHLAGAARRAARHLHRRAARCRVAAERCSTIRLALAGLALPAPSRACSARARSAPELCSGRASTRWTAERRRAGRRARPLRAGAARRARLRARPQRLRGDRPRRPTSPTSRRRSAARSVARAGEPYVRPPAALCRASCSPSRRGRRRRRLPRLPPDRPFPPRTCWEPAHRPPCLRPRRADRIWLARAGSRGGCEPASRCA